MANDIKNILSRTIPKTITVTTDLDQTLQYVEGDSGQLNHAVMNICINAVDALKDRGELTIRTRNRTIGPDEIVQFADIKPGNYVSLEICDNGVGMDQGTLERVFEPFFTTKPQGQGTGLGLAMVYGAVKNHQGGIHIASEPNRGTTVTVCLPAISEQAALQIEQQRRTTFPPASNRVNPEERADPPPCPRPEKIVVEVKEKSTRGTVLLVDDEPMIRNSGKRLLARLGYTVLLACNGEEAVELYQSQKKEISFVVLDLIMPVMDGEEAFSKLHQIDPEVRVLLSSGFSKEEKAEELIRLGAAGFIQKPFDLKTLARELAKIQMIPPDCTETPNIAT